MAAVLTDGEVMAGLLAADAIVLKLAGVPNEGLFRNAEQRLFQALGRTYLARAERLIEAAKLEGDGSAVELDVRRILARFDAAFRGWDDEMEPMLEAVLRESYRASKSQLIARVNGKLKQPIIPDSPHLDAEMIKADGPRKKPRARLEIKPGFSVKDEAAIKALTKQQMFWIGEDYSAAVRGRVEEVARKLMLESGLGRREAGNLLQEALRREFGINNGDMTRSGITLPPGWKGRPAQYFEGLAANTVTVGRSHGAIRTLTEIGIKRYQVNNPIDERTCGRCTYMNEKTFETRQAMERIERIQAADSPDEVRRHHPWAKNAGQLSAAEAAGKLDDFSLPPFHFRCRCGTDVTDDMEIEFEPGAEAPVPKHDPVEQALREGKVLSRKKLGGGANATEVVTFQGDDGPVKGVFKSVQGEAIGLRSNISSGTYYKREIAASRVAEVLGVDDLLPKTVERKIGRTLGSVQAFAEGAQPMWGLSGNLEREAAERMRVFDWVVGNTDRHTGNVLWVQRGEKMMPVLIDHGLCFPNGAMDRFIQPTSYIHKHTGALLPRTLQIIESIDLEGLAKTLKDAGIEPRAIGRTLQRAKMIKNAPEALELARPSTNEYYWDKRNNPLVDPSRRLSQKDQEEIKTILDKLGLGGDEW